MAGALRRAIYRRFLSPADTELDDEALRGALRERLGEAAMMAGILGGHVMLLFSVAFLRTKSQVIFEAWFEFVPALALLGTVGFTLAVRPLTRAHPRGAAGWAERRCGGARARAGAGRGATDAARVPELRGVVRVHGDRDPACMRPGPVSGRPATR